MKHIFLTIFLSQCIVNCSDDKEELTFFEKHGLSEWQRTDNFDGHMNYLTIILMGAL